VARAMRVSQQTVTRCLERAAELGVLAALGDRARPGRDARIAVRRRTGGMARQTIKVLCQVYHETRGNPSTDALQPTRPPNAQARIAVGVAFKLPLWRTALNPG